jgi:hypothetical protein
MNTTTATQTGLVGFVCEVTEEPVSFDECLACAQRGAPGCPMIPAAIHDIASSIRDPEYANHLARQAGAEIGFSATELLGCPRQYVLKKQHPYWEKPTSMYRMAFGSGYHAALANYPGGIREQTLTWKFTFLGKSILLVGTPDYMDATPSGWLIVDYKVTANPPFGHKVPICVHCDLDLYKGDDGLMCPKCGPLNPRSAAVARVYRPPQARSSHAQQVNLYSLLIKKDAAFLEKKYKAKTTGFSGAQVVYLSPKTPVRCDVALDREGTLAFLKARLTSLRSGVMPPVLDEPDELWRCDYCPVRAHCETLHGAPVGKATIEES